MYVDLGRLRSSWSLRRPEAAAVGGYRAERVATRGAAGRAHLRDGPRVAPRALGPSAAGESR